MTAFDLAQNVWALGPLISGAIGLVAFLDKVSGSREEIKKMRHTIAEVLAEKRARATAKFFSDASRWNPEDIGGVAVNPQAGGGLHQLSLEYLRVLDTLSIKARHGDRRCSRCLQVKMYLPLFGILLGIILILLGWAVPSARPIILVAGIAQGLLVVGLVVWIAMKVRGLEEMEHDAVFGNP